MKFPQKNHLSDTSVMKFAALALSLSIPSFTWAQEEEKVITLDPFTITSEDDNGYIASNAIAGTRTNTPIKDIALNIQVFTKDFADDLLITDQVELSRYNASLVNGNSDVHSSNTIQQSYNNFLMRGFIQNWSLRDGVRNYDPVDSQGFERVEVVKGPMAAMYGLTYPGGVINTISKRVIEDQNFTDVGFTIASEGEYRATIDMNITAPYGDDGQFGIRYNGVYSETEDYREHSSGKIEFNQINLLFSPLPGTKIELLAEEGYKEKPVGLGYFFTPELNPNYTEGGEESRYLGNGSSVPLQVYHKEIDWDWNWANTDNMRSIDNSLYKAQITQQVGEDLTVNAYIQYSDRVQIDSDGLNANGMGGSAAGWDVGWSANRGGNSTGWVNAMQDDESIDMHWHHRDWRNKVHAYGITGAYNFEMLNTKNTVVAGLTHWKEEFISHKDTLPGGSPNVVSFEVAEGIDTTAPLPVDETSGVAGRYGPPNDYFSDVWGAYGDEFNENTTAYVGWQMYALEDRLTVNAALNYTDIKLEQYANALATKDDGYNKTESDKYSPLIGAIFDITDEISIYGVHGTSLFPTTDKNDFDQQLPVIKGKSKEIGLKFDLMKGKLSGTISYYEIKQEGGSKRDTSALNRDKQRFDELYAAGDTETLAIDFPEIDLNDLDEDGVPTGRANITDRNGARGDLVPGNEHKSTGFEVDLAYQPLINWQILLSYAWNDNGVQGTDVPTVGSIDNQLSLVTKYSFIEGPLEGLSIGMGAQYQDEAYQGDVEVNGVTYDRYNPESFYLEVFAGYEFQFLGYDSKISGNIKNLTEQEEFVGWKATGDADSPALDRYEVPTEMVYSLTFDMSF